MRDRADCEAWIRLLGLVAVKRKWRILSYCLLKNHFHVVLRDLEGALSDGMRELNGVYARRTNERWGLDAHLFRNRFWSKTLDDDEYLLGALRYSDRNAVEAGLCDRACDWPWGSYAAVVGKRDPPPWLAVEDVLALFGRDRRTAIRRYRDFVEADEPADAPAESDGARMRRISRG